LTLNNSRNDGKFFVSSNNYSSIRTFEVKYNKVSNSSTFVLNSMNKN